MQEQNNPKQKENSGKNKSTEFFEKREMNNEVNDADNAGDDTFTPIYLNDESVLQTPGEKKHDDSINLQQNDKVEVIDTDRDETMFDKLNDNAQRRGMNE